MPPVPTFNSFLAVIIPAVGRLSVFAVISVAVIVPTVISGVSTRLLADVAIPTTPPVRVPEKFPLNVVAVMTPRVAVMLLPTLRSVNVEHL